MADYFIGEIVAFAGNYVMENFLECDGQALAIGQYQALFTLIGTTYGGDGQTSFRIPDLRGVLPLGVSAAGTGPTSALGARVGQAMVSLSVAQMPNHNHMLMGSTVQATSSTISQAVVLASTANNILAYNDISQGGISTAALNPKAIGTVPPNGTQPHDNIMPTGAAVYMICYQGIFPNFS